MQLPGRTGRVRDPADRTIAVRDELASGALIESAKPPNLTEAFFGVTVERRFSNPLQSELIQQRLGGAVEAAGLLVLEKGVRKRVHPSAVMPGNPACAA